MSLVGPRSMKLSSSMDNLDKGDSRAEGLLSVWVCVTRCVQPKNVTHVQLSRGSYEEIKIGSFRQKARAGAPAPLIWNSRSERVFGCGL
jgi:hypothetical protein